MKTKRFTFLYGFVESIELVFSGNDSCIRITAAQNLSAEDKRFLHHKLRKIADMLDATPDNYEFNPGEIRDDEGKEIMASNEYADTLYFKKNGDILLFRPLADPKHPITSDEHVSVIAKINEADLPNVASKMLRELQYECFITSDDTREAHVNLHLPRTALDYISQRDEPISR